MLVSLCEETSVVVGVLTCIVISTVYFSVKALCHNAEKDVYST